MRVVGGKWKSRKINQLLKNGLAFEKAYNLYMQKNNKLKLVDDKIVCKADCF